MPKCGQLRVGAAWVGSKEPDLIAPGRLRYYDKRCRTRIIMGAIVRGKIANNSIFRVDRKRDPARPGVSRHVQLHYRYFEQIGAPGTPLAARQAIFRQAMAEIKAMPDQERQVWRNMEAAYWAKLKHPNGMHKALWWGNFYLKERLPQLWPPTP